MKWPLTDLALAVLLTFPVYIALAKSPPINDWFLYGRAWEAFQPLFDIGRAVGINRQAAIVIGAMFAVSFTLSLIAATVTRRAVRHLVGRQHRYARCRIPAAANIGCIRTDAANIEP